MARNITTCYYTPKKDIDQEFLNCLQQRKIDEKFSYIGERQANSWINICNSPEYTYYRESKKLLQHCIQNFVADHTADVNIIVLGTGDALKEKIVVNHLLEKCRVNLFFVDISKEILNIAVKNIEDSNVLKELFIADFTKLRDIKEISQYIKTNYNATNFFTFLGNTIGNYPQALMLTTLRNIMAPGDKILIDIHTKPPDSVKKEASQIDEIIKAYNNPSFRERTLVLLAEASIEATDGDIKMEFCNDEFFPEMEVIKQYFCFNRNKTITYRGENICFAKGDRILVGYSNKYIFTPLEKKNVFTSHGLRIINHATDTTKRYYQLLCELA